MAANMLVTDIHHYFDRLADVVHSTVRTQGWVQQFALPDDVGKGTVSRLHIRSGMEIVISDMVLEQNLQLRIQESCRLFELNYCVNGEIYCEWGGKESVTSQRTGNICFFEDERVYMEKKAGIPHRLLEVRLRPEELLSYAEDSEDRRTMELLLKRHKGNLDRYPDSPAIQQCVFELMECGYTGALKRLYMESKAMELISLYVQEAGQRSAGKELVLRPDDIEKLKTARELALSHLEKPLSIRALSSKVGLNEYKLKKGFREVFGMTVFELVRNGRMEKALDLMETERLNVGETAVSLGYSNMSNFTAAFRKRYGCNPGAYMKQINRRESHYRKQNPFDT
ncbi:helix-turn-helix domain-containing protein [Paenibacillus thalictri]|uniref:AraC family transcriptional regulator n=1 Tax=Paenibacillus thalictri TaxID=2527873 RepID=A0A4Q9DXE9_9BACL|nr:AraC family transcriptional regulator [Paenibacillus thalictri]TBL81086.1 AraC family transcriptional regulator [Paenibacillus thalictri]